VRSREAKHIEDLYKKLINIKGLKFPKKREKSKFPTYHGVYIIYGPGNNVLHVGRTLTGNRGIRQRINDHLHGASSFVIKELKGNCNKLRKAGHHVSFLEIPNDRTRAFVEAYTIGCLCPKHIGTGRTKKKSKKGRK
jgi:hypothetical protein